MECPEFTDNISNCVYRPVNFAILFAFSFRVFFFSSRRRHTRCLSDWSSDVCSSDLSGLGRAEMRGQGLDEVRIDRPMALPGTLLVLFLVVGGAGTEATIAVVGVALVAPAPSGILRSEERRVGQECRARAARYIRVRQ